MDDRTITPNINRALLFLFVPLLLFAQAPERAEVWQTDKSDVTGRSNITVSLIERDGRTSGVVTFVNPDGSSVDRPIINASFKAKTLSFQTDAGDDLPFSWNMAFETAGYASLTGSHREMIIEERLTKKAEKEGQGP